MTDILLDHSGDIALTPTGDISATNSISQAINIRLKWFFAEWRFIPSFGVPYFEDILVKNPNHTRIRHIIREQVLSVDNVTDVSNIAINIDPHTRIARFSFDAHTAHDVFREEVTIPWHRHNTD